MHSTHHLHLGAAVDSGGVHGLASGVWRLASGSLAASQMAISCAQDDRPRLPHLADKTWPEAGRQARYVRVCPLTLPETRPDSSLDLWCWLRTSGLFWNGSSIDRSPGEIKRKDIRGADGQLLWASDFWRIHSLDRTLNTQAPGIASGCKSGSVAQAFLFNMGKMRGRRGHRGTMWRTSVFVFP